MLLSALWGVVRFVLVFIVMAVLCVLSWTSGLVPFNPW